MGEGKHTVGPWEACGAMVRTTFMHGDPEQRGLLIAECAMGPMPSGANARLIAAAPDLLDALEMLCIGLEWNIDNHPTVMNEADHEALANARAVIARATGVPYGS
jgi:hypothetical protein